MPFGSVTLSGRLEPLPPRLVRCAMTKSPSRRSKRPNTPPALPPRLKELARQLAVALREAQRKAAARP